MQQVTIYALGSSNHTTWRGRFIVILACEGRYKSIVGSLEEATTDQCTLTGIIEAVHLINTSCALTIVTSSPIAFGGFTNIKGSNKELKGLLIRLMRAKHCRAWNQVWPHGRKDFRKKIADLQQRAVAVEPTGVLGYYGLPRTTQLSIFND